MKTVTVKKFREEDLFEDNLSDTSENFDELVKTELLNDEDVKSYRLNLNWCRGCGNHQITEKLDESLSEVISDLIQVHCP